MKQNKLWITNFTQKKGGGVQLMVVADTQHICWYCALQVGNPTHVPRPIGRDVVLRYINMWRNPLTWDVPTAWIVYDRKRKKVIRISDRSTIFPIEGDKI